MMPGYAVAQAVSDKNTTISLGVFVTDQDMETALASNLGDPTDLDFEGDLGLDPSTTVFRFDASHQFNDKHSIAASVFDLSRDATVTIDGEIEYQDTVFPISTRVTTELDFTIYKLSYVYDIWRREDWHAGASIGLYTADMGISLRNENTQNVSAGDVTAPLPVFGLRGSRNLSDRWTFHASGEAFVASFDQIDGFIYDVYLGVDYNLSESTAIGLAWNAVELDIDATGEALNADLKWSYSGAVLFLKFAF